MGKGMDTKQGARVIRHGGRLMANKLRVVSMQARNKMASDMRKPGIAGLNVSKCIGRLKKILKRLVGQISIGRFNFITKKNKEITRFADYATMGYFRLEDRTVAIDQRQDKSSTNKILFELNAFLLNII